MVFLSTFLKYASLWVSTSEKPSHPTNALQSSLILNLLEVYVREICLLHVFIIEFCRVCNVSVMNDMW